MFTLTKEQPKKNSLASRTQGDLFNKEVKKELSNDSKWLCEHTVFSDNFNHDYYLNTNLNNSYGFGKFWTWMDILVLFLRYLQMILWADGAML